MPAPNKSPIIVNIPLWKYFAIGLVGSMGFVLLLRLLLNYSRAAYALNFSNYTTVLIGRAFVMPFYLALMASLWKCAYNPKYRFLGHLARLYTILTTGFLGAICITMIFFK